MKKISQKLGLNRKKYVQSSNDDAVATSNLNDGQCRQDDGEPGQSYDGSNINRDQLDREELDASVQAASQALQSTRDITGKQLKKDDKPGYYGQLTASVVEKLSAFTDLVQKIADAHPYSKIAWMIISSAVTVTAYAQGVDQSILDLFTTLDSTYKFIEDTKEIESHPSYERILTNLAKQTVECAYFIRDYAKMANFWIRAGKNLIGKPIKTRVKLYQDAFDRILTDFRNHSVLHSEIAVGRLLESNESMSETLFLGNLPYAPGAGLHTGKKCLPGTRAGILDEMINWVNDVDDNCPRLFWLAGPAGVGKSAIAHSIALWFQSIGRLGSFFCFDRNRSTERREKVFPTIARDLADLDGQIRRELVKVVHNKTSLQNTTDLKLQWTHFLFEPLQALSEVSTGPILIVIDALDESGDPISRQELLKVLAKETPSLPANIRFLVTSRPEQDIIVAFRKSQSLVRSKMMNSIPEAETKHDILTYFKTNLAESNSEEPFHFGDSQLTQLVELSQGLFQWAHLALQFLCGLGNNAGSTITERFDGLINFQPVDAINDNLDTMYTQILSSLFDTKQPRVMTRFRSVIGSILAASESLSINSFIALRRGNIPSSQREADIKAVIQYMGSLLSGIDDPSSTIRPLHLSFREYLLDKNRSKDFSIDLSQCHQDFAFGCLRTMNEGLRFNICDISNSHQSNANDEDLPARISSRISILLSYSSRFWGLHVSSSAFDPVLARKVEEFLHQNFLYWLEVMSLLRIVHVAARSMSGLVSWSLEGSSKSLHDFAVDGNRFIRLFNDAMTLSTPHIYLSALPFCPEKSTIYQTFIPQFPNTLRVASNLPDWPFDRRTMSLLGDVACICFSHGGEYLAVGLKQGILIINSESFDVLWTKELESRWKSVESIQFLQDDKSLVFSSCSEIYLFDILTGNIMLYSSLQISLQMSFPSDLPIVFSPDAKYIAAPTHNLGFDVIVWNLETDKKVVELPLKGKNGDYSFSNSDNILFFVTCSFDIGVQVWDLETGAILHGPFRQPSGLTENRLGNSAKVSPDGKHIVFWRDDFCLTFWNFRDNSIISVDKPRTRLLTFSPDGDRVITRSSGGLFLHYMNGNEVCCETVSGIAKAACSKDGRWLAAWSDNHLVIRELDGWESTSSDELHPSLRNPFLLDTSSDGKYIILKTWEESFVVWDVQSGQPIWEIFHDTELGLTSTYPILSPMNRYIGHISKESFVDLYDIDSRTFKGFSFGNQDIWMQDLAFSQDEKCLAILSLTQRIIYIWDIDSSRIIETLTIPESTEDLYYQAFGASSNFRYFAYTLSDVVTLIDRTHSICLELPAREPGLARIVEHFAFSLNEDYLLITRDSVISHINLITKEHQMVRLQRKKTHAIVSQWNGHMWLRKIYSMPGSGTLLVEICGAMGFDIWDAISGQLLYSKTVDYPFRSFEGFIPVHQYWLATTEPNGLCRMSALKQKNGNHVCFSSDDRHSLQLHHELSPRLREDGWVVTQDDELLFWVPEDYHSTLHIPGLVCLLGKESIELDLSFFSHGESWIACKMDK